VGHLNEAGAAARALQLLANEAPAGPTGAGLVERLRRRAVARRRRAVVAGVLLVAGAVGVALIASLPGPAKPSDARRFADSGPPPIAPPTEPGPNVDADAPDPGAEPPLPPPDDPVIPPTTGQPRIDVVAVLKAFNVQAARVERRPGEALNFVFDLTAGATAPRLTEAVAEHLDAVLAGYDVIRLQFADGRLRGTLLDIDS
jgi:hypothetical protein